jgi:cytochrome c2
MKLQSCVGSVPTSIRLIASTCSLVAVAAVGLPALARAEGDAAIGRTLYERRCLGCHGDANTPNAQGPTLVGVVGRRAGTAGGGTTSRALSESGIVWDEATLRQYLAAPGDKVHGTIMPVGAQRVQDRDDLVAYLKSLR